MTTADLARAEFMTPQSMGASVAELEEHGLVARTDDPSDGRRKLVSLTRAGSQVLAESRARRRTWLTRAIETELDPSEQRRLLAALELLRRVTQSTTHQP
jgi:DNA-binding MarR family transcriptional regulator